MDIYELPEQQTYRTVEESDARATRAFFRGLVIGAIIGLGATVLVASFI